MKMEQLFVGATSTEEVLQKFQTQRDTRKRLEYLRRTTELDKRGLEMKQNKLNAELENYKYAQEMDKDKKGDSIVKLKADIQEQQTRQDTCAIKIEESQKSLEMVCRALCNIYVSLNEIGIKPVFIEPVTENSEKILTALYADLVKIVTIVADQEIESKQEVENETTEEEIEQEKEKEESSTEEMILPQTYNILLRRMPVQTGQIGAPAPVGTDDEEEVPSRGFLKRQAQLIVDAKRRKNIRIPNAKK